MRPPRTTYYCTPTNSYLPPAEPVLPPGHHQRLASDGTSLMIISELADEAVLLHTGRQRRLDARSKIDAPFSPQTLPAVSGSPTRPGAVSPTSPHTSRLRGWGVDSHA
jgi:hypothetical protein